MQLNFANLLTDVPTELTAVRNFVTGVEKLVSDAKSAGLTSVTVSDVEALVPAGEEVIKDTEKIIGDV